MASNAKPDSRERPPELSDLSPAAKSGAAQEAIVDVPQVTPTSAKDAGAGFSSHEGPTGTTSTAFTRRGSMEKHKTWGERTFPTLAIVVTGRYFEMFIAVIILVNCITIGMEAEVMLGKAMNWEQPLKVLDHIFTFIFTVELILRLLILGWRSYLPRGDTLGNFLDALIVVLTGIVPAWIMPLLGISDTSGLLETLTVFRALRLMRLVRVVQRVESFKEMWLLLRGLSESGRTLLWTVLVIFFITYVFAIFGVVLISTKLKEDLDDAPSGVDTEVLRELVSFTDGVMPFMFTLIQVLTLDSWNGIARPIQDRLGFSWAFFYLYIAVAVIVMMNLVTAIIVDNALSNSRRDAEDMAAAMEKAKQEELAKFKAIFQELDEDGNGELTWPEFESAFDDPHLSSQLMLIGIDKQNCKEIFDLLDTGDGAIDSNEFFDGIARIEGPAQSKELLRSSKLVDMLLKNLAEMRNETQEDFQELLRNTPGAVVHMRSPSPSRKTSFRSGGSPTWTSQRSGTSQGSQVRGRLTWTGQGSQAEMLVATMQRLDEVANMVLETRTEFREAMTKVNQDMVELKSNLPEWPQSSWRRRISPHVSPARVYSTRVA